MQHVSVGSTVGLECTVSHLSQAPSSLLWTKEGKPLTAKDRSGVSIEAEKLPGVSTTRLFLSQAELTDSANYSCKADENTTASVLVIVTKGQSIIDYNSKFSLLLYGVHYIVAANFPENS